MPSDLQTPSSVDWRTKGVVTPVKNQVGYLWLSMVLGWTSNCILIVNSRVSAVLVGHFLQQALLKVNMLSITVHLFLYQSNSWLIAPVRTPPY